MMRAVWWLALAGVVACESSSGPEPFKATPYDVQVEDFPTMEVPVDNPTTVEGIALGRRLFYDPILSSDDTISCSSCHRQENAFADPRQFSVGVGGATGTLNAPGLINPGWNAAQFWDARAENLETQAEEPVPNPIEMNLPWAQAIPKLQGDPNYPDLFAAAFGTSTINQTLVARALAQFQRTLVSNNSRWDKILALEVSPTAAEIKGSLDFDSELVGDCFHCHGHPVLFTPLVGPSATAGFFEDNGLDLDPDEGYMAVTGLESDRGKFKVPTLRNIAVTAPYMHDGRFATLEEVLDHYSHGYVDSPNLNTKLRARLTSGDREMTEQDKADIIQFLHALTDDEFLTNPALSDPFEDD